MYTPVNINPDGDVDKRAMNQQGKLTGMNGQQSYPLVGLYPKWTHVRLLITFSSRKGIQTPILRVVGPADLAYAFSEKEDEPVLKRATLLLLMLGLLAGIAAAQEPATTPEVEMSMPGEVMVEGLNNPRHLTLGADGTLYVAEAGLGGTEVGQGPFSEIVFGTTGQITAIANGEKSVIIPGLISMDAGFGQIEGPMAVTVTETDYWVVLGMGPQEPPEGARVEAVVQLNRETMEVGAVIDLRAFEAENNPDGAAEVVSNPADLAVAADGALLIADASGNSVIRWTAEGGATLFASWPGTDDAAQAVPTSLAIGPDGDVYVGFLSGFPFASQGARIERYSAAGELKETYAGLTLVTDILVTADGTVYAVEMASGFGETGFNPNSGRIVMVHSSGLAPLVEGLNIPYGMVMDGEGNFWVTANSAFAAPDGGVILRVPGM
jgi:hypothetical protein